MANATELILKPCHGHGIERCGFLRKSAAPSLQLQAQTAERTSATRKLVLVPLNVVHEGIQTLLGGTQSVQLLPEFSKIRQSPLHHRLAWFFLRLEVVV